MLNKRRADYYPLPAPLMCHPDSFAGVWIFSDGQFRYDTVRHEPLDAAGSDPVHRIGLRLILGQPRRLAYDQNSIYSMTRARAVTPSRSRCGCVSAIGDDQSE